MLAGGADDHALLVAAHQEVSLSWSAPLFHARWRQSMCNSIMLIGCTVAMRLLDRDIFFALTIPPPFLHGVGHPPYQHRHPPIYIKRSTVNMYKIDSG